MKVSTAGWVALVCSVFAQVVTAAPLCFGVVEIPPLGMRRADGQIEGRSVSVIDALGQHSGLEFHKRLVPLARGLRELSQGHCDLLLALPPVTPDPTVRSLGPVAYGEIVLIPRAGVALPPDGNWQGARIVSLVGGVAWGPRIDIAGVRHVQVVSLRSMIEMLKAGRTDAVIGLRATLESTLRQAGYRPQDFGPVQSLGKLPILLYAGANVDAETGERLRKAAQTVLSAGEAEVMLNSQ